MTPLVDPKDESDSSGPFLAKIVRVLEARGVEYAFTGSFALAYWFIPRTSKDIDIVVLATDTAVQLEILEALAAEGLEVPSDAVSDLKRGYHSTAVVGRLTNGARLVFELLAPKPGEEKLAARIVRRAKPMPVPALGRTVPVVSPEDLSSTNSSSSGRASAPRRRTT